MTQSRKYTAYCGLYCLDCIPSNQSLFETVDRLQRMLSDLQFDVYAELKSTVNPVFKNYGMFNEILAEIGKLKCIAPCSEGGCKPDCDIRDCVKSKNYEGCWECARRSTCELLDLLKGYHGETIDHNLEMIKKYGPDNWSGKRGKHYPWL